MKNKLFTLVFLLSFFSVYAQDLNLSKIESLEKKKTKIETLEKKKTINLETPKAIVLTILLPGMGDRIVNKKSKIWPIITGIYVGSIGAGVYFKYKSKKNYDLYQKVEYEVSGEYRKDLDKYYNMANINNRNFNIMIGAAGAVLVADIINVTIRSKKNTKKVNAGQTFIFPNINFYSNSVQFCLIQKF